MGWRCLFLGPYDGIALSVDKESTDYVKAWNLKRTGGRTIHLVFDAHPPSEMMKFPSRLHGLYYLLPSCRCCSHDRHDRCHWLMKMDMLKAICVRGRRQSDWLTDWLTVFGKNWKRQPEACSTWNGVAWWSGVHVLFACDEGTAINKFKEEGIHFNCLEKRIARQTLCLLWKVTNS